MRKFAIVTLQGGERVWAHRADDCLVHPCPIHSPSDHHMRWQPQRWRSDRQLMERVCDHGLGHPDPDEPKLWAGVDSGVHGCDGCCQDPSGISET